MEAQVRLGGTSIIRTKDYVKGWTGNQQPHTAVPTPSYRKSTGSSCLLMYLKAMALLLMWITVRREESV